MGRYELGPLDNPEAAIDLDGSNNVIVEDSDGNTIIRLNQDGSIDQVDSLSVTGLDVNDEWHWASTFDGADVDARLDAAIAAASDNEVIYLESGTYTDDRTISTVLTFIAPGRGTSPTINANWTLNGQGSVLQFCRFDGTNGSITLGTRQCLVTGGNHTSAPSITVQDDECIITENDNLSVTFESGTSNGVVDSNTRVTVTDNGSNTVGDNS